MKKLGSILIALFLLTELVLLPATSSAATPTMKVHFINVGQGDATYIKSSSPSFSSIYWTTKPSGLG